MKFPKTVCFWLLNFEIWGSFINVRESAYLTCAWQHVHIPEYSRQVLFWTRHKNNICSFQQVHHAFCRNDRSLSSLSRGVGLARYSISETSSKKFKKVLEGSSFLKRILFVTVICGTCAVIADGILTPGVSGTYYHKDPILQNLIPARILLKTLHWSAIRSSENSLKMVAI